ncbi:glycosyltransferase [Flavobacterium sp. HBTb2-11-1]|uniref:glycosyltransferase n=1 Tax=Flavobacterium sp. HBTb2-11-1 TaxID=2692212 RepID=UPI001371251E|nr:glycosyltransferase [Flavobacterium sp. HBTb2-11-1]MXO03201.1 glycosyltransferase [Flavobacterium sp. HBTb2-11-1]
MKVVHIIEALGGGVYTYFNDLSAYFGEDEIKNCIDTTIIYSGNRKEIDRDKIKSDFSSNINLLEINMLRNFSPLKDLKSVIQLTKALKKINPDVIHLHSSKAGVLGRIAYFFLFKKKKLYYSPHGYSFLRTDISKPIRKIYWLIEKITQALFGGVTIACGDTEFEIAKKIGNSKLVRNGVDIRSIRQNFVENKNDKLTVGILGRITYQKNPILFNEIALNFPDFNFVWIGDGELNSLLTAPNIKITGWFFDRKHILKELNNLDVYLQTSLWEGLPIAVLEAMVLEKPVIATNVIGNKDIVIHNETGFLFDEISELEPYFQILSKSENRNLFAKKAFERCSELFDKNKNFEELIYIYKS